MCVGLGSGCRAPRPGPGGAGGSGLAHAAAGLVGRAGGSSDTRKSGCREGRKMQERRGRRPSSSCAVSKILLVSVSTSGGTPFPLDAWGSLGAPCCSWALRPMLLVGKCTQKSAGHGALFLPWRPSNNTACCTQACYGAELGTQACATFTLCSGPVPCPLCRQPCRAPATVCRGGGGMRMVLSIKTICEEVAPKHHKGMERDLKSSLSLG